MMRSYSWLLAAALLASACSPQESRPRAVGQLESDRIELVAEVAEKITARHVAEGSRVAAGDLLFSQDSRLAQAGVEEAEAQVAQSQAALDELLEGTRIEQVQAAQAEVAGAKKERAFRVGELNRIRDLAQKNLASAEQRDTAQIALDSAIASLDAAEARLQELLKGPREKTIEQAAAGLQVAQANLQIRKITLQRHETRAPVDGVLDRYLFEIGERPNVGQVIAVLLSGAQPHARVYIPADIRPRVQVEDSVAVHVDGFPNPLRGTVRWISSEAAFTPYFALTQFDRTRLSYLAKIDLPVTDKRLPDGVPLEVEFAESSGQ